MRRPLLIAVVTLTAAVALTAQQPQTPGQLRPRPAEGREPEFPQPTIREYKPRSTLVVPQHPVPRAKFAVIDMHGHPFAGPGPVKAEDYEKVVKAMDGINVQLMVNVSGASGERLKQMLDVIRNSPYPDRMAVFTNINFRDPVGPGFGAATARQIEDDVKNGARGLGEIMKGFGLTAKKLDGSRLHLDDPELDPIWDTCARLNIPVHIHTADPAEFFQPIDFHNERWLELALYRDRRYDDRSKFPSFEELMGERDRLFARHPKTKFIVAHMGWHANDLARIGGMLDRMPNLTTEVGAVLYDIGRQPRAAHEFFLKYQDRIMFGKDAFQPDEYPSLLACVRNQRRVFRLLPRLSRVLKLLRHRPAGQRAQEALLSERDEDHSRPSTRTVFPRNGQLSRHGRRRLHRLASRGGTAATRAPRPVADSLITGKRANLDVIKPPSFSKAIWRIMPLLQAVAGMDYVLHQAAIPSVPRSVDDPVTSNRANITATINTLWAAKGAGVKRLVYAASSSAYGNTPTLPKREDMPTHPLSPYALQKFVGEQYCQLFTNLYGFETVSIRYFNVFGPRQDPGSPYSGVISQFALALLAGRQPMIYGDGGQTRDFTYVATPDGVLRARAPKASGGSNVAVAGRIYNDLVLVMNGIIGSNVTPVYKEPRAGDVRDSQADISKAKSLLGYEPSVPLEQGLKLTLDWFRRA
jgi:nucleoside-diphosphate-sugar epimerase/predicted TIM-barrel fold metal-dependent hydrolase